MALIEWGAVREIWLAKMADPTTKWSFLVRDDARSKQGVVFGRSLRLGEPVNLGPNSTWQQVTWEGGKLQDNFRDKAMYQRGGADVATTRGKAKMWQGWVGVNATTSRAVTRMRMVAGPIGLGISSPLFMGEDNPDKAVDPTTGTTVPPSGFAFYKYDPTTATTSLLSFFTSGIRSISPVSDEGSTVHTLLILLANSQLWNYRADTGVFTLETTLGAEPAGEADQIVPLGDSTYITAGNALWKRTHTAAAGTTFSSVKAVGTVAAITAMAVWQNRIWLTAITGGGLTQVLVSDGQVLQPAFVFPDEFTCSSLRAHYGSLYFAGSSFDYLDATGVVKTQIWRYSGSSLTKLFQEGYPTEAHVPVQLATHDRFIAWCRPGTTGTGRKPGLTFYDAETDAIFEGPSLDMDPSSPAVYPQGVARWSDTWVAFFRDYHNYGSGVNFPWIVAYVRGDGSPRNKTMFAGTLGNNSFAKTQTDVEQYVLSSVYDGDIPEESKVWLTARVRVKLPSATTQVVLKVILDGGTTEQTVSTVSYDAAATGWRSVTVPMRVSGEYLRSTTIQYKLYLRNIGTLTTDVTMPEVDSVSIDFRPSPSRQRQWRLRAVCSDAQGTLGGPANSLTTGQAQEDKLEELWAAAKPVLFWDASSGGGPIGGGTEVFMSEFNGQSFRVDTSSASVGSEVGFSLVEIVQA